MHGMQGVTKCVIFDVRSIFEVQFLSKNFSLYMVMVGLRNFSRYNVHARKPYDQPSLNLNNSTIWRATLILFSEFQHRKTVNEKYHVFAMNANFDRLRHIPSYGAPRKHQNRFRPGLYPGPSWGAHDAPTHPLVGWEGIPPPHSPPHSCSITGRLLVFGILGTALPLPRLK